MLTMLAKFLKILGSDASPMQIAFGFALALFIGLTPFFSLHNLVILFFAFITRVNLGAFFLASAIFTLIAYLIDPWSISLGEYLLTLPDLQSLWTHLYQSDFWRAFKFNHTLLMGSLAIAVIAFIPVLLLSYVFVVLYRHKFMAWVEKLKITKWLKASKFYKVYEEMGA